MRSTKEYLRKTWFVILFMHAFILKGQEYIHPSTEDDGFLGESERFMFFEHYWLNTHHWLYNMGLKAEELNLEEIFTEHWEKMSDPEKETLTKAIEYYKANVLQYDLRTSGYTYHFKRWVVTQPSDTFDEIPGNFLENVLILKSMHEIYKRFFWDLHHEENKAVFEENIALIKSIEYKAVVRLNYLCQDIWQEEKIRVDICYHSKLERPYTTTGPVAHIVMDSNKNRFPEGNWAELILHESAHHLMGSSYGFVAGTIINLAKVHELTIPRQLAHSYLFYFTGKVAQELFKESIPDYELYMVRNKVFSNRFEILDKHLSEYMNNEKSLADVTLQILKSLN